MVSNMRVLWQSNSTHSCFGYGILGKNVVGRLRNDFGNDVIVHGCQTIGKPIKDEFGNVNLPMRGSAFGVDLLDAYIKCYGINTVITAWDYFLNEGKSLVDVIKNNKVWWVAHATINTFPMNEILRQRLSQADIIVAPSEYNMRILNKSGLGHKTVYIPHGVDLGIFKKASDEEREDMKKDFWEENYEMMKDKFVFLCVNRNKGHQKNFFALFESMAHLIDKNPEIFDKCVFLFVTDFSEQGGEDINGYINTWTSYPKYSFLKDHVINVFCRPKKNDITKLKAVSNLSRECFSHFANFAIEEDEMNKIYNISDCFVSTTMNESAGLPILESMGCGLPVIMTKGSTCDEYVRDPKTGIPVDIEYMKPTGVGISKKSYVNSEKFADAMIKMFLDKEFRIKCSDNAKEFIKNYDWDNIVEKWDNLIKKVNVIKPLNYGKGDLGL